MATTCCCFFYDDRPRVPGPSEGFTVDGIEQASGTDFTSQRHSSPRPPSRRDQRRTRTDLFVNISDEQHLQRARGVRHQPSVTRLRTVSTPHFSTSKGQIIIDMVTVPRPTTPTATAYCIFFFSDTSRAQKSSNFTVDGMEQDTTGTTYAVTTQRDFTQPLFTAGAGASDEPLQ